MTCVISVCDAPAWWERSRNYVYIGRPLRGLSRGCLSATSAAFKGYFGNPFVIGIDGQRGETISKYRAYIRERLAGDAEFKQAVRGLAGKTLVCFCKPRACHGDVLAEWADALVAGAGCLS